MAKKLTRKEKIEQSSQFKEQQSKTTPGKKNAKGSILKVLAAIVGILGFLLYTNTFSHQYALDDFSLIKDNRIVQQGADGIGEIFTTNYRKGDKKRAAASTGTLYRPLTLTMFAYEWEISPDDPGLSHIVNVVLYGLLGALMFLVLARLLNNYSPILPFATMLLFMAHPIHTEVVANIKSRDEILGTFLVFGALWFILNYLEKKKMLPLILAGILFFLGFLAKESTISFVGLIPLCLYFFRNPSKVEFIKIGTVLLVSAAIFIWIRTNVLGDFTGHQTIAKIDNLLKAAPNLFIEKISALKIMGLYLWKLVLPHPLANDYSFNQIALASIGDWKFLLSAVIHIALAVIAIKGFVKKSLVSFGIIFYLGAMALYSNIFLLIGSSFGERFLFVPSLAFCLLVAWGLIHLLKIDPKEKIKALENLVNGPAKTLMVIVGVIVLAYGFKTIDRNAAWESNASLYETDVITSDQSARSHYYLGLELTSEPTLAKLNPVEKEASLLRAIGEYEHALVIYPGYADVLGQIGLAQFKLARIYRSAPLNNKELAFNSLDQAEIYLTKALEKNPNAPLFHGNLGSVLFDKGKLEQAKKSFENAIQLNPLYEDAWLNLGATNGQSQKFKAAADNFLKVLEINPRNGMACFFLATTYDNLQMPDKAQYYRNQAAALGVK